MKKILKLRIPETLNEITLGQYQAWIEIATKEGNAGTDFLKQKTIEIFCHVPLKFVATMAYKTAENVFNQISNVLIGVNDLKNSEREKYIVLNNVEYGFIPDFENITMGEVADLDSRMADYKSYHEILSILYRPVTMKLKGQYDIKKYEGLDNPEVMKELSIEKALRAVFFLLDSMKILELNTLDYLREEIQANPVWKQTLEDGGVGTTLSYPLLSTTYLTLMLSPIRTLERC